MKVFAYYLLGLIMRGVFLLSSLVPERPFVYCLRKVAVLYVRPHAVTGKEFSKT